MGIFLLILKIIGIIIASIVGLVILLVLFVLFSPVRYKGRIRYDGEPDIVIKASWLCHIVNASFVRKGDTQETKLKIFFKDILKEKEKAPESTVSEVADTVMEQVAPKEEPKEAPSQEAEEVQVEPQPTLSDNENNTNSKKSVFKRLKDIYNSVISFFKRLWASFNNMLDKRNKIMAIINDTGNREAVSFTTGILKLLLKHILPRKHRIYVTYGTGDPASTGQTIGYAYAAAALLDINLIIEPDFENKVFTLDMPFKGRISTLRLIIWGLQLYRHKKLRRLIHRIQSGI